MLSICTELVGKFVPFCMWPLPQALVKATARCAWFRNRLLWYYIFSLFLTDESGDEESVSQTDKTELQNTLRTLSSKVEDLSTCNDLIAKHGTALQRSLSELETLKLPAESNEKIKQINERATLFRITSNAMINVSGFGGFLPVQRRESHQVCSSSFKCSG